MMEKKEYNFSVETIRYGQRRAYEDSYYEFIVESDQPDFVVKNFCTNCLKCCRFKSGDDKKPWYASSYSFGKIAENKYKYSVVEPYLD